MVTLFFPGDSVWHRMPAGPKAILLAVAVLGLSLIPTGWWAAAVPAAICVGCYLLPGLGPRQLGRQLYGIRWLILILFAGQLLFAGLQPAVTNTTRVAAVLVLASLLSLTTRVSELLDAIERGLRPLAYLRIDPQRVALLLAVTLNTLPVLARAAGEVREAQRARGGRGALHQFAVPFLILALKHADALGEALTARGVR